jgi:hypothetical protein
VSRDLVIIRQDLVLPDPCCPFHRFRQSVAGGDVYAPSKLDEDLALYGKGASAATPPPKLSFVRPGDVGSGLLTMMREDGTEPAMPSTFLPLGRSPAMVEECMATDGRIFRWHLPTGKLFVYPPAA